MVRGKVVRTKTEKIWRAESWLRFLVYALPFALIFSYYPVITLGQSETMNLELSVPLIWLMVFDVLALYLMIRRKVLLTVFTTRGQWLWLLFPLFATISVIWSLNVWRGILVVGILWLIYLAVYGFLNLRDLFAADDFREKFWRAFFAATMFACGWCVMQCVLDLVGVSREGSLMCAGCVYQMFGFPHPNGFAIEPQFMGNLLLAPAIVAMWKILKKDSLRFKWWLLFFVIVATLFLTFSRGAIYAFAVATVFMMAWTRAQRKNWRGVGKVILTIVVAFLFTLNAQGIMAAASPTNDTYESGVAKVLNHLSLGVIEVRERTTEANEEVINGNEKLEMDDKVLTVEGREENASVFDGYVEGSTDTRIRLSSAAGEVWAKNPATIWFGVGLGGAGEALYQNGLSPAPKEIVQNEYMSLLLEMGLMGISLFVLTLRLILRAIVRGIKIQSAKEIKTAKVKIATMKITMLKSETAPIVLTLMVAYGITLMFFSGLPNALHIYLLTGLIFVLGLKTEQNKNRTVEN